jgi:DUF971 family protein
MKELSHHVLVSVDTQKARELSAWCKAHLPMLNAIPSQRTWDYRHVSPHGQYPVTYQFSFQDDHMATLFALTWGS